MEMTVQEIVDKYRLRLELARVLSVAIPSKDFREYENNKKRVQNCCNGSKEYEQAIRCLTDIMGI